jgi:hypothetical protein
MGSIALHFNSTLRLNGVRNYSILEIKVMNVVKRIDAGDY